MSSADRAARYRQIRFATLLGGVVNVLLAALKLFAGWFGQSQALIADGLHSLADLATDALVLVAARFSRHGADDDHPYGHARIETAATVGLGLLLIGVAAGIIIDAGERLLGGGVPPPPGALALGAALASLLIKEILFRYTLQVARRARSPLLQANAWHHRSDAVSSLVVLFGVLGAQAGLSYFDAFAAVAVALMIGRIGLGQAWGALQELTDRGLEPDRLDAIRATISDVEGVRDLHSLRTRRMGGEALVDVHVQVSPRLSVSEGHQIGEYVRSELRRSIDEVTDVTVHIDSEDDDAARLGADLPLRREFVAALRERWSGVPEAARLQRIDLHYLQGRIDVDVVLPLSLLDDDRPLPKAEHIAARLRDAARGQDGLGDVQVLYALAPRTH